MPPPLSRRQFIAQAWRAGIGVGALALAGCSAPETPNSRRDGPPPDPQNQPIPTASPLAPAADEQDETAAAAPADGSTAPAEQSPSRQTAQSLPITAPPVPADAVDPLVWRERYHWRELARLPGRDSGPVETSSLHLHAPAQLNWSPFHSQSGNPDAGTFLPLLYSQLLVMAAGDSRDAHRGEIEGDLAASWETPEPTTLLFRIRPDVAWPDAEPWSGRPLTASDVRISHDAYLRPGMAQASAYEAVERIEADDRELIVAFHLREPASYLPARMTDPLHVIGAPHQLDDPGDAVTDGAIGGSRPIPQGTGPFELEWASHVSWGAVRNPGYFKRDPITGQRLPHLRRIRGGVLMSSQPSSSNFPPRGEVWRDWTDGRFDAIELLGPSELDESRPLFPGLAAQLVAPTPGRGTALTFRATFGGPFADARVRQALSASIDRVDLADRTHHGLAAPDCGHDWTHAVDASSSSDFREWPWTPDELGRPYAFDPAYARSLLSAAGYDSDAPLQINLDGGGGSAFVAAADTDEVSTVGRQWQTNLGPAAEVRIWPRNVTILSERNSEHRLVEPHRHARILATGWQPRYQADPDALTYGRLHSSVNPLVRDPLLDQLCEQQRRELDPTKRSGLLEQIRQRDLDVSWRVPLINPYGLLARRGDVFDLRATHIAHDFDLNPKQLERAWHLPR